VLGLTVRFRAVVFNLGVANPMGVVCSFSRSGKGFW